MANCVSEHCRKRIDEQWAFCPYCGADNRPPAKQVDVGEHHHRYLHRSGCCLLCGEPSNEPYVFSRKWRVRFGLSTILLAVLSGLFILNIRWVMAGRAGVFGAWIREWCFNSVYHRSRRYGGGYTTLRGDDVSMLLGVAGIILFVLGLALLFRVPMRLIERSPTYWAYQDDQPRGHRRWWW